MIPEDWYPHAGFPTLSRIDRVGRVIGRRMLTLLVFATCAMLAVAAMLCWLIDR